MAEWWIVPVSAAETALILWPGAIVSRIARWCEDIWNGLRTVFWMFAPSSPEPYMMTVEEAAELFPGLRAVPVEELTDPAWLEIVGVPFEVWCNAAIKCHGPRGLELGSERLAYLRHRRDDLKDFREPVDLVKRYRRIPEPTVPAVVPDPYILNEGAARERTLKSLRELHEVLYSMLAEGGSTTPPPRTAVRPVPPGPGSASPLPRWPDVKSFSIGP